MKHISMKCMVIFLCLLLGGCGTDTQVYLETTQERIPAEDTQQNVVPDKDSQDTSVLVYVCGEVKNPGVYELTEGMRICDAVEAAGGLTDKAGREYWNLAELLTDGQMLYFPTEEEAKERQESSGGDSVSKGMESSPGKVNINTAGADQLMTVPGIGQTRADAILNYRAEHGSFVCVEDIMKVSGIKNALFEKMRDYITVG